MFLEGGDHMWAREVELSSGESAAGHVGPERVAGSPRPEGRQLVSGEAASSQVCGRGPDQFSRGAEGSGPDLAVPAVRR